MKRIWMAITLLLISTIFATTEFSIVDNKYNYFVESIKEIEDYFSSKEFSKAKEKSQQLLKEWEYAEKSLNVFLSHEKVDEVTESLAQVSDYAKSEDEPMFSSTCEKTKRQLLCLKQSELPNLENIM